MDCLQQLSRTAGVNGSDRACTCPIAHQAQSRVPAVIDSTELALSAMRGDLVPMAAERTNMG